MDRGEIIHMSAHRPSRVPSCLIPAGLNLALFLCGCDADPVRQAAPQGISFRHNVDFQVIPLSGYTFEPQIRIVQSAHDLRELVPDTTLDVVGNIDHSTDTAIHVSWYLPDPCTTRTLDSVREQVDAAGLELYYTTHRESEQFCPQVIAPFEQLVIISRPAGSAYLIVDDLVLSTWP